MPVAARHRARKLLPGRPDDLERADPARRPRPARAVRQQPHTGPVRRQPPVRRQRRQTVAVRAGNRARPEVVGGKSVRLRLRRKVRRETFLPRLNEALGQPDERWFERRAVQRRPRNRGAHDQRGDGIQVVGHGADAEPHGLEGNAPSAGRRIEHRDGRRRRMRQRTPQPPLVFPSGNMAERSRIAVRLSLEAFSTTPGRVNPAPRSHRIPMNPEHVQEPLPIRVLRQQRRQHRRPRRHQRPARPPDVEVVRRRQRGHGPPLPHALLAECRNRQPAFDQASVGHRSASISGCLKSCVSREPLHRFSTPAASLSGHQHPPDQHLDHSSLLCVQGCGPHKGS